MCLGLALALALGLGSGLGLAIGLVLGSRLTGGHPSVGSNILSLRKDFYLGLASVKESVKTDELMFQEN